MKYIKYTALLFTLFITCHAHADKVKDAWDAYHRGDYPTAFKSFATLAEQGNTTAQFNLGVMYDNGIGVARYYKTAIKWYRLAAEQGHSQARYKLGTMYDNGRDVARDYQAAMQWYRLAAEQGHTEARYMLGRMYDEGRGVEPDDIKAYLWFDLAAADFYYDKAIKARDAVAERMTPEQLAKAQAQAKAQARAWSEKHSR